MADTSIKISLELADATAQKALSDFISKAGTADKSFKKLGESSQGTFTQIGLHIGKASGIFEIFAGNVAANVAIKAIEILAEAAHKLFEVFVVDGVKAAEETQNAINSLNVAFAASGQYSKETTADFLEFAEGLQKTTTFSHSAIVQNAALIESLTQLDKEGLKRATQAALDMSAALGKDLPTSANILAKAAEGNVTALKKLGITIQEGRTNAETLNTALQAIEERFGGAAQSKVNTFAGAVSQASNAFEDMTEEFGNAIVLNQNVVDVIKASSAQFSILAEYIKNNNAAIKAFVTGGLQTFIQTFAFAVEEVDLSVRIFQTLYGVISALSLPFVALTIPIRALTVGLSQAMDEANEFALNTEKNLLALGESGRGSLTKLSQAIRSVGVASTETHLDPALFNGIKGLDNATEKFSLFTVKTFTNSITGLEQPLEVSKGKVVELTAEMKRAQDRAAAFAEGLIKAAEEGKVANTDRVALAKAQGDAEIALNDELLARKLITQSEFEKKKALIEVEFAKTQQNADIDRLAVENELVNKALADRKISDTEFYAAKTQLRKQFESAEAKNDQLSIAREAKTRKAITLAEQQEQRAKVQAVGDTFSALSSLTQTKSKELFEIGKAASIAAALINTYQAITLTMASVPYPFNIPLAIAQGIAGAVQVTNIEQTSPAFESGGVVPGSNFSGDRVPIRVNSGEMILNRTQQSELFKIANKNSNSSSGQDIAGIVRAIAGEFANQPIVVQIDGREVFGVIRSGLKGGRTFA